MKQMEQIGKIPEANGGDRNIIYDLGIFHRHTWLLEQWTWGLQGNKQRSQWTLDTMPGHMETVRSVSCAIYIYYISI